jgi:putative membrane protein
MRLFAAVVFAGALTAASALAQTGAGNPAAMAPGTPQSAPGMPGPHQPNQNDRLFVYEATIGGNAEVLFGQMAEQKGTAQAVTEFGRQMVADHGKANQQLSQLAQAANVPQPNQLDEEHQAMRAELDKLNGAEFDFAYIRGQVADHQKTAQLFEWEIGAGQDPQLKAFTSDVLPVVLRHLQMATALDAQLSATAAASAAPGAPPGPTSPPRIQPPPR